MAGPMFHYNFGKARASQWSFGFEASVWDVNHLPFGADLGLEYETGGLFRIYSEAQTGAIFGGGSAGPVLEFAPDGMHGGIQGGAWLNFIAGVDVRGRKLAGRPMTAAPGYYVKAPLYLPHRGL